MRELGAVTVRHFVFNLNFEPKMRNIKCIYTHTETGMRWYDLPSRAQRNKIIKINVNKTMQIFMALLFLVGVFIIYFWFFLNVKQRPFKLNWMQSIPLFAIRDSKLIRKKKEKFAEIFLWTVNPVEKQEKKKKKKRNKCYS